MPNEVTLNDIPILQSRYVHMKNEKVVLEKINKIVKDGVNKLQVVTDFDLTLTKQHVNGRPILSSFGIFRKCTQLPEEYKIQTKIMYEKYRPIEINPNLPLDVKIEAMKEWNESSHKMLSGCKFDPKEIEEVAQKYGCPLRDRSNELFIKLNNVKVPVLVFSAGLGNIVEAVLKNQSVLYENVKVISNFLNFNGNMLEGFKNCKNMIHVFNKNEHAVEHEYFTLLEGRHNVLLMGDTLGDASMADGVETESILRIGFLYEHVEESLDQFKDAFDIVLIDDQTMNVVLDILDLLFQHS